MNSITIVPATQQHTPQITAIINDVILNTVAHYDYKTRTIESQQIIITALQEQHFPFVVALLNNEVVGFGQCAPFRSKDGYKNTVEHSIYIAQQHQKKGIGVALLRYLENWCRDFNIHTMVAVIDTTNTDSILFHEKQGFTAMGTLKEVGFKKGLWLDTLLMQKWL